MSAGGAFRKKVPPPSFVAAVTKHGDQWILGVPFCCWPTEKTFDWKEALRVVGMERGLIPRVSALEMLDLNTLPPVDIHEHGFGYCAVREGYDGAPDSHCPIGIGRTKAEAVADLVEQEELHGIAGSMVV